MLSVTPQSSHWLETEREKPRRSLEKAVSVAICSFLIGLSKTMLAFMVRLTATEVDGTTMPLTTRVAMAVSAASKGNDATMDSHESSTSCFRFEINENSKPICEKIRKLLLHPRARKSNP